ncbi:hypothetical protein KVF89_22640 [Nocardioides carbamazepini]|uniref:hypothetical protein n=1 Tax=Nocardioides carbamazepini TaxID=2854259 RepID=UPI00214A1518|nr:hypothetical protein [Nocardioides carbamazepini]MCR1785356.1 hypothetical protein [Nocardioides carbamazepini]
MSLAVIECPPSDATRAAINEGWTRYEQATKSEGRSDEWDNRVILTAIKAFVRQGRPFSANDFRDLLPEVRKCLISRRLIEAQRAGWIRRVGFTPSTLKSTKNALVRVYAPIPGALDD